MTEDIAGWPPGLLAEMQQRSTLAFVAVAFKVPANAPLQIG